MGIHHTHMQGSKQVGDTVSAAGNWGQVGKMAAPFIPEGLGWTSGAAPSPSLLTCHYLPQPFLPLALLLTIFASVRLLDFCSLTGPFLGCLSDSCCCTSCSNCCSWPWLTPVILPSERRSLGPDWFLQGVEVLSWQFSCPVSSEVTSQLSFDSGADPHFRGGDGGRTLLEAADLWVRSSRR